MRDAKRQRANHGVTRFVVLFFIVGIVGMTSADDFEWLKREVPTVSIPHGARTVDVNTVQALRSAVSDAQDGDVIRVADGTYELDSFLGLYGKRNVMLIGASGDPEKVVLKGRSWDVVDHQDDILRIGDSESITVAHLTFAECHAYGIKVEAEKFPRDIHIFNCRFFNIATRAIKGSTSQTGVAVGGSIRFCRFENSKIPASDWQFDGNYISAIDMMALEDWTIADNTFLNIRGASGVGRAAIFLWVRSKRLTVERNVIVGCDRGIALGNPSGSTNFVEGTLHAEDSICRNNVISAGEDAAIELSWVEDVRIYNNSIYRNDADGRGIRAIQKIGVVEIANNLVRGQILIEEEGANPQIHHNVTGELDGYWTDPTSADLRLTEEATDALNGGVQLTDVTEDFAGTPRGARPDVGAWESP
jgi:hypothetical protein